MLIQRINKYIIIIIIIIIQFFGCSTSPRYHSHSDSLINNKKRNSDKIKKGNSKNTYNPNKKIYKGVSSFYGPQFHGKLTANGEIFDMYGITAAHKEFPFNTIARVTNIDNGKSQILRINDRGPYIDGRILDCSFGAAKKLNFIKEGIANVKIEIIEWGDGEYMHHD